jgi:ElaB/YqjD/DUF883 family membrane-anchored ribosome-binding protein
MRKFCILLVSVCCSITVALAQDAAPVVGNSRTSISRDLITLRDSVNNTLNILQKNSTISWDQRRSKAVQDLTRNKVQLDKTIDEVVNTKRWTKETGDRTTHTIDDVRREYSRIRADLKEN